MCERVRVAAGDAVPLAVTGGGTKDFLGRITQAEPLDVSDHRGIVTYEPTELVLSARGGTPLAEVEAALGEQGQMLAFEPPGFGEAATIGGTIATGLSGPARPWAGAARDFVLGTRVLNGRGEALRFGGEVMKNVAGYDVSRLMTGACGTLGVLLEVSLKVLPRPAVVRTLAFDADRGGSDPALQRLGREAASRHRGVPRRRAAARAPRGHRGRRRGGGRRARRGDRRRRRLLGRAPRADVAVLRVFRRSRCGESRLRPAPSSRFRLAPSWRAPAAISSSTGAARCAGCAAMHRRRR